MDYFKQILNGFLFGAGFILAAAFFRIALHISFWG